MTDKDTPKNILFVTLSGIGNLLMQLPTIEATHRMYPKSHIAIWVAPRGTAALAKNIPYINEVVEAPIKASLSTHVQTIRKLRKTQADIGIILSPGQLWKSAAYLKLAGIPVRLGHTYKARSGTYTHRFLTHYIHESEALHDIEQNLTLLSLLPNSSTPSVEHYALDIPSRVIGKAEEQLKSYQLDPNRLIIGFHAGSAPNFSWKRWPLENFAKLAQALIDNHKAQILLFGGPDEMEQNKKLRTLINRSQVTVVQANLLTTAAILKKCQFVVSNDSGVMHLSSAIGTKTFGLFGPTDEKKTGPRGSNSHVIRADGTSPVYDTEKNYDLGTEPHPSICAITPQIVLHHLQPHLPRA